MSLVTLKLSGPHCDACTNAITNVLKSLDNVTNIIKVSLDKAEIEVIDDSGDSINELITEITDIGYEAELVV